MDVALPNDVAKRIKWSRRVVDWLEGRFEMWGEPPFDIKSEIFWEMMFDVIKVWEKLWPKELDDWQHNRKIDLAIEKSLPDLVKGGLKKSVGYPQHLYQMMRMYWPDGRFASRDFARAFKGRFPIFNNSNYT
jgi:hypothetical protein